MKNVTYALEKALSDGSNYNLSCWFDFLYALGTRSIVWHCNISYCLKVKVLVLLLNRQHSLILNTLSGNDCTLHLKGQWTHPTQGFVRFGKTKGEIRLKKGDFRGDLGGFWGVWTLFGNQTPHPLIFGKTFPNKTVFLPAPLIIP